MYTIMCMNFNKINKINKLQYQSNVVQVLIIFCSIIYKVVGHTCQVISIC